MWVIKVILIFNVDLYFSRTTLQQVSVTDKKCKFYQPREECAAITPSLSAVR